MECMICKEPAVIKKDGYLCKEHFLENFESQIDDAISRFSLIGGDGKDKKIIIATSGGKDSLTVLDAMKKRYVDVDALAIDEGISDYREETLTTLKAFCEERDIKLLVVSFKKEFGFHLDEMIERMKEKGDKNVRPCTICGTLRRYLLNKYAKEHDIIATGHNMDDELQSFLMNVFKGQIRLSARLGPITGLTENKKFVKRIKPLYLCSEKDIRLYSYLKGYEAGFDECPYAHESFRHAIAIQVNALETGKPGTKKNMLEGFIKMLEKLKKHYKEKDSDVDTIKTCEICGAASQGNVCNACRIIEKLK